MPQFSDTGIRPRAPAVPGPRTPISDPFLLQDLGIWTPAPTSPRLRNLNAKSPLPSDPGVWDSNSPIPGNVGIQLPPPLLRLRNLGSAPFFLRPKKRGSPCPSSCRTQKNGSGCSAFLFQVSSGRRAPPSSFLSPAFSLSQTPPWDIPHLLRSGPGCSCSCCWKPGQVRGPGGSLQECVAGAWDGGRGGGRG